MDTGLCCDVIQQKRGRLLIFAGAHAELSDLWTRERLRPGERCRVDVEEVQLKAVEDETSKERKQQTVQTVMKTNCFMASAI